MTSFILFFLKFLKSEISSPHFGFRHFKRSRPLPLPWPSGRPLPRHDKLNPGILRGNHFVPSTDLMIFNMATNKEQNDFLSRKQIMEQAFLMETRFVSCWTVRLRVLVGHPYLITLGYNGIRNIRVSYRLV